MLDQVIHECQVCFPSLSRAEKLVPAEFLDCWHWFLEHEGQNWSALPYGPNRPDGMPIPLARQAGIYSPSVAKVTYRKRRYALSIHSSDVERYPDKQPLDLGNGTWVFDYAAQDGDAETVGSQAYDEVMISCLEDAIPIGVMIKDKSGGYRIWGLAYVERYNSVSKMYTLHGPVNFATERMGLFDFSVAGQLSKKEASIVRGDDEDESRRVVSRVARLQQESFRHHLMFEYNSTCAVTGADIPEVLQAAHIEPYRGKVSQNVSNGLLLRSDVHLLYDAHLISVVPEQHVIRMSDRLRGTAYECWNGERIRAPKHVSARPDDELLEHQYKQFLAENRILTL